jgi:hypothetical protein
MLKGKNSIFGKILNCTIYIYVAIVNKEKVFKLSALYRFVFLFLISFAPQSIGPNWFRVIATNN